MSPSVPSVEGELREASIESCSQAPKTWLWFPPHLGSPRSVAQVTLGKSLASVSSSVLICKWSY